MILGILGLTMKLPSALITRTLLVGASLVTWIDQAATAVDDVNFETQIAPMYAEG